MSRLYVVLDVFTGDALAGNPLAVVLDASGLDSGGMQAIAREFNLSETVFLLPADDEARKAKLRIFTPARELPFAGHPTVGTAVLLGLMDAVAGKGREAAFEIEEAVGVIACRTRATTKRSGVATFALPRLPEASGPPPDAAAVAAALGLEPDDIGFDDHVVARFDAGNPFCFVPLKSVAALGRATPDFARWTAFAADRGAFLYTSETGDPALAFRARMFSASIREDPATGSAVAAFAGAIMAFDNPGDGESAISIGQGFEMGRPSLIELGLNVTDGALISATIGGAAVVVAEGTLFVR
ncbi:PhzF family phenazine biosynthesis protein [Hansschlegelia quercus]|uniref:PhzF family phenazine biosynthesis protein n=1 Tax=Hansschlegelia quercus TaxID=2528245 RepID=A0A4Q9GRU4_9HYPH|nr:PhzF family phenazine biosynthesis protein [Hansschlegelia quercus]TBN54487.1 PhzF family phenazine biosynthesis protein [Hansschlegelia quercus]